MFMDTHKDKYDLDDLKTLMKRLRSRDNGCPWDIEQTFDTIKPHTIEEAYEVADAIERGNMDDLKDELGDLLFQVVFHAQMGDEGDLFSMDDIIDHVTKKMIFRHPHVFESDIAITADDVKDTIWEAQKNKEKPQSNSALDGLMPAMDRVQPVDGLPNSITHNTYRASLIIQSVFYIFGIFPGRRKAGLREIYVENMPNPQTQQL